jgi:hypothetical protein
VHRKDRAFSRAKPGGLRRSLDFTVELDQQGAQGVVFVNASSEAGRYAFRIHEERFMAWWDRGPGTIAAGERAREKFIERALVDGEGNILDIIRSEAAKVRDTEPA